MDVTVSELYCYYVSLVTELVMLMYTSLKFRQG